MKKTNDETPINKKKIPSPSLEYRPRLENLPAYSSVNKTTAIDLLALTKGIPLSSKPDYLEEIYAIIPVNSLTWGVCCIIYRENVLLVEETSQQIAMGLLESTEHLEYPIYKETLHHLLQCSIRLTPVANRHYSLFPTGSVNSNSTMWINPGRIVSLFSKRNQTVICLENLFTLSVNRHIKSIKKHMSKAFWAHAILKRENDIEGTKATTSLLEYLNITSSSETRTLLKNLEYQHIPDYKNEFFKNYLKFNRIKLEGKILKDFYHEYGIEE